MNVITKKKNNNNGATEITNKFECIRIFSRKTSFALKQIHSRISINHYVKFFCKIHRTYPQYPTRLDSKNIE